MLILGQLQKEEKNYYYAGLTFKVVEPIFNEKIVIKIMLNQNRLL